MDVLEFLVLPIVAGVIGCCALVLVPALIAKRRRLRTYERLTKSIPAVDEADTYIPVRYASAGRFAKWWKVFPWELCGILRIGHDRATFHTSFSSWTELSLDFDQSASQVSWFGRTFWRNSSLSWVIISRAGKRHYFSTETGTFIFGSKRTTEELYRMLNECLSEEIT